MHLRCWLPQLGQSLCLSSSKGGSLRLKFLSLETKTQSQLIGRLLHELAAPWVAVVRPGSYQRFPEASPLTGLNWYGPEDTKGTTVRGCRYPEAPAPLAEMVRPGTCQENREGAPSPSSTTPAWAEVLQPRGDQGRGGRHRPAAPPSPGPRITARRVPRPRAAIAQQHHLHLG